MTICIKPKTRKRHIAKNQAQQAQRYDTSILFQEERILKFLIDNTSQEFQNELAKYSLVKSALYTMPNKQNGKNRSHLTHVLRSLIMSPTKVLLGTESSQTSSFPSLFEWILNEASTLLDQPGESEMEMIQLAFELTDSYNTYKDLLTSLVAGEMVTESSMQEKITTVCNRVKAFTKEYLLARCK